MRKLYYIVILLLSLSFQALSTFSCALASPQPSRHTHTIEATHAHSSLSQLDVENTGHEEEHSDVDSKECLHHCSTPCAPVMNCDFVIVPPQLAEQQSLFDSDLKLAKASEHDVFKPPR